jgi:NAD-dependent dihydropyrimidine dehydrogenase PreA subunit
VSTWQEREAAERSAVQERYVAGHRQSWEAAGRPSLCIGVTPYNVSADQDKDVSEKRHRGVHEYSCHVCGRVVQLDSHGYYCFHFPVEGVALSASGNWL